ncbi:MAG: hypothetical protein HYU52_11945 [Acidobacteria bacterium]|nr:hypothetical protein [Acidobacteriota bacterium]
MHRKTQRVYLSTPIKGRLGDLPVAIVEIGLGGAGLEHAHTVMVGERHHLHVDSRQPFRIEVVVRHSQLQLLGTGGSPSVFRTGVELLAIDDQQELLIDSILIDEAREKIAEWEANLAGTRRITHPTFAAIPHRPHAYAWHRLVRATWSVTVTRDPNQPIDGFAVCDDEPMDTVTMLRQAYERYDEDDRYMLRMMAQLAISERDHLK